MELTKTQKQLASSIRLEVTKVMEVRYRDSGEGSLDFLMGAAAALHAVDVLLFNGDDAKMRTFPPLWFMYGCRDYTVEEFVEESKALEHEVEEIAE